MPLGVAEDPQPGELPRQPGRLLLPVRDYALPATLTSGQAFRWQSREGWWESVIGARWVRLASCPEGIVAETAVPVSDWRWLTDYLQTGLDLEKVLLSFPADPPLRAAVLAWRGLRLLRQEPWECLASFICSSTKQIVQIQQIIRLLCERFGAPVSVPPGHAPAFAFPTPAALAAAGEPDLRACNMGFRAPNLLRTARLIAEGRLDLAGLASLDVADARARLIELPGVGPKIANCVLLFAGGFQEAFPVDVWVMRALRKLYFSGRQPAPDRLRRFTATHFGPYAGYAQQYLFHYMRTTPADQPRLTQRNP